MIKVENSKKLLLVSLKFLVPVILLAIIFSRVDPGRVLHQMINVHLGYFSAGLVVGFGLQITGGAWRWRYFLKKVYGISLPYGWVLKHYWIGMFLGYFVPGHVGWDAYRIAAVNQRENAPLIHVTVVLLEKIIGLFSCVVLIFFSYPFIADQITGTDYIRKYINYIYALALILALAAVAMVFLKGESIALIRWVEKKINGLGGRYFNNFKADEENNVLLRGIRACWSPPEALVLWGSSIFIRSAAAAGGYLTLKALYQDISIMINFFAVPMMLFLILVPVSFGGIGIREGVFILLYGLFGIPASTSLSASYLGLIGLLFTISIGGIIMLWNNARHGKLKEAG